MTEEDKKDDLGGEKDIPVNYSIPKYAQPAYGFVRGFIDAGLINHWVVWAVIAILLFHAWPDNSSIDLNFPINEKNYYHYFFKLNDSD